MSRRLVTPIDNYIEHNDGEFSLKDENIVGFVETTHLISSAIEVRVTTSAEAIGGLEGKVAEEIARELGKLPRLEVSWQHKRVPAIELVDPETLAFIGFEELDTDDDDDTDEAEEDYERGELEVIEGGGEGSRFRHSDDEDFAS